MSDIPSPRPNVDIRTLESAADLAAAQAVFSTALLGISFPVAEDPSAIHEPGRALGAFDGEQVVGSAEAFTSWMAVPGGARVSHAAVTDVGVLPTHTRRGILTALMTAQLQDIAARGEVVASLRASEGVIYERYGYGVASRSAHFEVTRQRAALRPSVTAGSPVRLADPDTSEDLMRQVCERMERPGTIGRFDVWWKDQRLWAAKETGPRYLVVSGEGDEPDGYALYGPKGGSEWFGGGPRTVSIDDLMATSEDAYIGLVRHFSALDLTDVFELDRPVDDPLAFLFTDTRAVKLLGDRDETWLRLVDVEAALRARTYTDSDELVISVDDPILEKNTARFTVGAAGITRTQAPPDLSVGVSALAAVYLGGCRWSDLALAGQAREMRTGAITAADALFATPQAPYAGTGF